MIRRKILSSLGNTAFAMSIITATGICALGQTVATLYLATGRESLGKSSGSSIFLAAPAFRVRENAVEHNLH